MRSKRSSQNGRYFCSQASASASGAATSRRGRHCFSRPALDETGTLEHTQVLRDGRRAHLEGQGEVLDDGVARGEPGQDGAAGRVGEGGEKVEQHDGACKLPNG